MSVIAGLLLALLLLLATLVLLAVLVCLLLVAALALVVLLERTGTDMSTATSGLRERLQQPGRTASSDRAASGRLPWSRRKPAEPTDVDRPVRGGAATPPVERAVPDAPPAAESPSTAPSTLAEVAAEPVEPKPATTPRARSARSARTAGATTGSRTSRASAAPVASSASAARDDAPTERLPVAREADAGAAPAPRTRPVRRPKPAVAAEPDGEREAAMDRLFAPLTETDRTEPLPRPQERQEG